MEKFKPPLFVPATFFMVRLPSLPIDDFFSSMTDENITVSLEKIFLNNPSFQEAIAVASPSLSKQAKKKIDKKTAISLMKYYVRMCSRSTPYGLFSTVSCGTSSEEGIALGEIDLNRRLKRARPDMGWLQKNIDEICKNKGAFSKLLIQKNPFLVEYASRFYIAHYIEKLDQKSASIQKNPLTESIFSFSKNSIQIDELVEKIVHALPHLVQDKVLGVIQALIEQQFLLFTLLPSLISSSPFEDFLKKIPSSYIETFSDIHRDLLHYSSLKIGEGEAIFSQIHTKMQTLASTASCIQVDTIAPHMHMSLPKKILEEVAKSVELLWLIESDKSPVLTEYYEKFKGKYGQHRLVPLYELLDDVQGLGMPEFNNHFNQDNPIKKNPSPFKEWLKEAFYKAIWNHQNEIEIEAEIVSKCYQNPNFQKASPSMDVFFDLISESIDAIDQGNYTLLISSIRHQGGSVFGRFLDMFDATLRDKLKNFYLNEEALDPKAQFVEYSYLPTLSRTQNVAINPNFRSHLIDLSPGGTSTLSLEDIYVGANHDRLFLTSKNGDVEYYVTATNMLSMTVAPNPLKFIYSVSIGKYQIASGWNWDNLSDMPFLPRIRFKKTILSPAKWNVTLQRVGALEKESIASIMEKFRSWALSYQMCRYVFICEGDNKLLVDIQNEAHLEILVHKLKQASSLLLSEKFFQEKGEWITSHLGKHSAEFVLPLIKNEKYAIHSLKASTPSFAPIGQRERWRLPGSDWLFAKIYLPDKFQSKFLIDHVSHFTDFLTNHQLISQWFFIRYKDTDAHLRLRLQANPDTLSTKVLRLMHNWVHNLIDKGIVQKMDLSSYEREIERYGGIELIHLIEAFFCLDSLVVLDLLKLEKDLQMPLSVLAAFSIQDILHGLNFDKNKQSNFYETYKIDRTYLTGFKSWKKNLLSPPPFALLAAFEKRSSALSQISERMEELAKGNQLIGNAFSITSSLIHMHCNRLMGIDHENEKKARAFAGYALQTSLY